MVGLSEKTIRIPEGAFSYPRCIDDDCTWLSLVWCEYWERYVRNTCIAGYKERY